MRSDGTSAKSTAPASAPLSTGAPGGTAYSESAGMQSALPIIVCGREKRQRTASGSSGLSPDAAAASTGATGTASIEGKVFDRRLDVGRTC